MHQYYSFIFKLIKFNLILVLFITINVFFIKQSKEYKNIDKNEKIIKRNRLITFEKAKTNCYFPPYNLNIKIIHLIITRFMLDISNFKNNPKLMFSDNYFYNGIRVLKKYLFHSLEAQNCKNFIWVLVMGN